MAKEEAVSGTLQKASVILGLLARHDKLSVAEIAAHTGQPRSSVYRLVNSLCEVGFVEAGQDRGQYRLGQSLFEFAGAAGRRYDIRREGAPVLRRLIEQVGVSVFLSIRDGYNMLCVDHILGEGNENLTLRAGSRMPLHLGAAAKLLLAYAGPEFWEQYVAHVDLGDAGTPEGMKGHLASRHAPHLHELERELETIRQNTLSVSDNDVVLGVAALGAPVRDSTGVVVAAISLGGTAYWVTGERNYANNVAALQHAAYELSVILGYDGGPNMSSASVPRVAEMGPIVEFGLVVPNLESALVKHSVAAPRNKDSIIELGPAQMQSCLYRGREVSAMIRYSPAPFPRFLTLISPVSGPSVHRDWLERHGEGIHQVTVVVSSLDLALEPVLQRGTGALEITRGVTVGPYDEWATLDTAAELGYLLRLAHLRAETPPAANE
ncbi:IclR family transcriptional regulator domain-containing protein [Leucobacter sp. W1038]|uniref:IclR family transcriptional regulator n=1 Tax=Leucobacter sp. W1038 TaxID=3438281 RepID=UPI003D983C31